MKLKIVIDDPETRAVWDAAQKAKIEVSRWPAWKRGEQPDAPAAAGPSNPPRRPDDDLDGEPT